ncbi:MAG: DNA topoisomerase VI subunit B, partial [Candidatus Thorarchaeota archaeon]
MSQQKSKIASFESISPAEFFYRNRQMAGFGNPTQAVYSAVRELVENSLDSCEDAQRAPVVRIKILSDQSNRITITVSDNGTGVSSNQIPDAFGRVLYGSKYSHRQKRGTFGLGVTMAVLYSQITTDRPMSVHSRTQGSDGVFYRLLVDIEKNQPIVEEKKPLLRSDVGTDVSISLKGDLKRSQERIIEYLRLSAVSTPHATFHLSIDDSINKHFGGFSKSTPIPARTSKPHPRAADIELLRRLIQQNPEKILNDFLLDSFQKVGTRTATKFL